MYYPVRTTRNAALGLAIVLSGLALASNPAVAQKSRESGNVQPPQVGELAPGFSLSVLGEDETVSLGEFKGKHDVVLIFGSYT